MNRHVVIAMLAARESENGLVEPRVLVVQCASHAKLVEVGQNGDGGLVVRMQAMMLFEMYTGSIEVT